MKRARLPAEPPVGVPWPDHGLPARCRSAPQWGLFRPFPELWTRKLRAGSRLSCRRRHSSELSERSNNSDFACRIVARPTSSNVPRFGQKRV